MFRGLVCFALALLTPFSTALAEPITPEAETAYRQGQADWDRGDVVAAMPKLKIAADAGHPIAQYLLAYSLDQADDDPEAAEYYRKSAAQGNPDAMFALAAFHLSGDGNVKRDVLRARELFIQSANKGHAQSLIVVVMAYLNGGLDFSDEDRKSADALNWLKRGADADSVLALQRLVIAHRKGDFGLPVDPAEADRLQAKIYRLQGIDPNAKKKRQRR